MPEPGRVLAVVIRGSLCPVTPQNFHTTHMDVDDAVDYALEAGIPEEYFSVALIEGLGRQIGARRVRRRVTISPEPARRGAGRRRDWRKLSLRRKRELWRGGEYRGWSRAEVRSYYEAGRLVTGVLVPTRESLEREPAAWLPYIQRNRTRLVKRYGEGYVDSLVTAGDVQRRDWKRLRGRTPSTSAALYVRRGRSRKPSSGPHSRPGAPHRSVAERQRKGKP